MSNKNWTLMKWRHYWLWRASRTILSNPQRYISRSARKHCPNIIASFSFLRRRCWTCLISLSIASERNRIFLLQAVVTYGKRMTLTVNEFLYTQTPLILCTYVILAPCSSEVICKTLIASKISMNANNMSCITILRLNIRKIRSLVHTLWEHTCCIYLWRIARISSVGSAYST